MKVFTTIAVFGMAFGTLAAQDMRKVSEPELPKAICSILMAHLAAPDGIVPADEMRPDTDRIQKALDDCGQGRAVELTREGTKTAFLTGPINMKKGVTLLVDRGVTVYGSRDPHVYD